MPRDFFAENQSMFTDPQGTAIQQEKFNLYGGLTALVDEIEALKRMLRNIDDTTRNIASRISNVESKIK